MVNTEWVKDAAILRTLVTRRPKRVTIAQAVAVALQHGNAADAWADLNQELFPDVTVFQESERVVESWLSDDFRVVSVLDDGYPSQLRSVHDAPPFLFYRGDLALLDSGGFSVVGTREVSPQGAALTRDIVHHLVERQIPVISGLARGIDQVAHQTTLSLNGTPIGVIATPITGPYTPAATRELHEMVAHKGVLISQFEPGKTVHRGSFLQRNATMSGIGSGTIIVEASENSGTKAQARNAMDHGRPVILTRRVLEMTQWAKDLADGRPSVKVSGNLRELESAITYAQRMEKPDLTRVLHSLAG